MRDIIATIFHAASTVVGGAIFALTVLAWFRFGPVMVCALDGTLCGR